MRQKCSCWFFKTLLSPRFPSMVTDLSLIPKPHEAHNYAGWLSLPPECSEVQTLYKEQRRTPHSSGGGARQTVTAPRSQKLGSAEHGVRPREGRRDGVASCQPWSKETWHMADPQATSSSTQGAVRCSFLGLVTHRRASFSGGVQGDIGPLPVQWEGGRWTAGSHGMLRIRGIKVGGNRCSRPGHEPTSYCLFSVWKGAPLGELA